MEKAKTKKLGGGFFCTILSLVLIIVSVASIALFFSPIHDLSISAGNSIIQLNKEYTTFAVYTPMIIGNVAFAFLAFDILFLLIGLAGLFKIIRIPSFPLFLLLIICICCNLALTLTVHLMGYNACMNPSEAQAKAYTEWLLQKITGSIK